MTMTTVAALFGTSSMITSCGLIMKRFLQTREVDLPPLNQTHAEILLLNLDLELQKAEATFGVSQDHLLEIQKIKEEILEEILKAKRLNTVLKRKLKFAQSEVQRFSLQNEKLNSQVNTIIASGNYQALPSGNDPAAGAGSPGWSTAIIFVVGVLALSTFQKRLMSKK